MPLQIAAKLSLLIELLIHVAVGLMLFGLSVGALCWALAVPFVLRAMITLSSTIVSRIKGISIKHDERLGFIGNIQFVVYEYFHLCMQNMVQLPFRGCFKTHSERGLIKGAGRVLLLQHGYVNNGGVWYFTARDLERQGYRVFTCDTPMFKSIDEHGDVLHARVEEVLRQTGVAKLTLISHSMGGLVCRAYLRRRGDARIEQFISLAAPHHGTLHAVIALGENGKQMVPGNAWLTALNQVPVTVPFTSIYSVHDTVISPQDSSVMPEATNVRVFGMGHVSMPSGRKIRPTLYAALNAVPEI